MLAKRRTYHDPLHGAITLDAADATEALLIQLIDTPAFQRLRRIRQLGSASLTFHGAESSRFTHSLGVMAIARRAFDSITLHHPELWAYRPVVLCGALLHDIGHGPFSHTCEEVFGNQHEHWTMRILQESAPVRHLLDQADPTLLPQLQQVYQKQHPVPLVWQLVSSQLDCDRLDYLMRDSHFTGATYGKLDLDRILMALQVDPSSQQMVVAGKGMAAIEHYLIVRFFMYAQIYNHPKNLASTWVLDQAFRQARVVRTSGTLPADESMNSWLQGDCDHLPLEHYLAADDGVFLYHLQRWQQHSDRILADLCRRFIDRDLLKATDISAIAPERYPDVLAKLHELLEQAGFAPDVYGGIRVARSSGYTLYQRGIKLLTETGLQEISDVSPLVKTLTQPLQRNYLIHPRDINAQRVLEHFT
ncbi:HD domain-containing protein [Leptolyngbya sp. AN02str]|uniref:HD domain-containing protein n=1 Tax=Leptolyngbya sp. AN02str TaxID=3423363 RepID=UPI003D31C9AB